MKPSSSGLPGWHLRSSRHRERTSAFERHTAGEMTKAVQPHLRKKGGPLIGQNNWLWEEWTGPFMTLRTHARALSSTLVQSVQDCSGAPLNSFPWASKALPAVPASAITVAGCCPVVSTQIYGRPICTCAGRRLLPTASYSGERPDIPAAWPAQRSHAHACDGALGLPVPLQIRLRLPLCAFGPVCGILLPRHKLAQQRVSWWETSLTIQFCCHRTGSIGQFDHEPKLLDGPAEDALAQGCYISADEHSVWGKVPFDFPPGGVGRIVG